MKKTILGVMLVTAALSGSAAAQPALNLQPSPSPSPDQQAITSLLRQMTADATTGNSTTLEKYFDPQVLIIDRNGVTQGYAAYKAKMDSQIADMRSASGSNLSSGHAVGDIAVSVSSDGNFAWAAYAFSVKATVDGQAKEVWGIGSAALQKKVGVWRIVQSQTAGRPKETWGTGPTK